MKKRISSRVRPLALMSVCVVTVLGACGEDAGSDKPAPIVPTDTAAADVTGDATTQLDAQEQDTQQQAEDAATTGQDTDSTANDAENTGDSQGSDAGGTTDSEGIADTIEDAENVDAADKETADGEALADGAADTATDSGPEDTGPEDTGPEDTGPPLCDPPLKISPQALKILPFDLKTFGATGGTGAYRFALLQDQSGAVLHKYTGAYLSGEKAKTTDKIELTDKGCVGSATATVSIVKDMQLAPEQATVPPATKFVFSTKEGSGSVSFALKSSGSGGTVNAKTGAYAAGTKDGTDVIVATDTATGQAATATIVVKKSAAMYGRPARLVIPVGSSFVPNVINGTGIFEITGGGQFAKVVKGEVTGLKPGTVNLVVTDSFTKQKFTIRTRVVQSFEPELPPVGDGLAYAVPKAAGDLNNDGYDDAVIGIPEADVTAYNDGAVLVYFGGKTGLTAKPAQVLHGNQRDGRFGSAVEVADVDGDGRRDLVVGEHLGDHGMVNNGGVHIFRGLKSGKFEQTASTILPGAFSSAQMGNSMVVCDFNNDGRLDIAAGAPYGENRGKSPVFNDQGDVSIHLGHEDGFLPKADQHLYGVYIDAAGKLKEKANLRIGWSLAAGDMDGDGACDLAVGSLHFPFNANNDGAVLVYKGVKASKNGNGGLAKTPSIMISGADSKEKGGQFGRSIAMGDFDGDKKAELAVGYYALDVYKGKTKLTNAGGYFAYDIDVLPNKAPTKWMNFKDTKWQVLGDGSYDYFGRIMSAGDVDGDGVDEILASNVADEVSGKPSGTGVLAIHKGSKGVMPSTTPAMRIPGLKGGDWFSAGAAAIGDSNKDGKNDLLVYASHEDTRGLNHGMPYEVSTAKIFAPRALGYDTKPAGSRIGQAVASVGDVTGDGIDDFVIGAPYAEGAEKIGGKWVVAGTSTGSVWVMAGSKTGFAAKPKLAVHKFYAHGGGELLGWSVSGAGDFDGDGHQDFAVAARNDDRPTTHSGSFQAVKCGGSIGDSGAVYVFGGGPKLSKDPIAVIWGPQPYDYIQAVSGARKKGQGDINGDGRDDVVFGSLNWDASGRSNAGGWGVAWGRPKVAGKIRVICKPDYIFIGPKANDYVGRSVAMLGDIDGDKCAEFAVGADAEDLGNSNQGTVRVIFGWGAKCKSQKPREIVLLSGGNNARAGYSMDAGGDVDGDGKNDLVVGGFNTLTAGIRVGSAWIVTAKYIASLQPKEVAAGTVPSATYPLVDSKNKLNLSVLGTQQNGYFGWSVAMVPGMESDGRAGIVVGVPRGSVGTKELAGGALAFRFLKTTGLMQLPWAAVVGETYRPSGEIGWSVGGTSVGGKPALVMGGYYGSASGSKQVDQGTAYISLID